MINLTTPSARRTELLSAVILMALVLGFALWYMATHQAPVPYMAPVTEEPAPATPEVALLPPVVIEEHAQYYDIEATYPAETALKASAGEEADQAAVALMKEFVESSIEDFKDQGNFANLTPEDIQLLGLTEDRKESILISFEERSGPATVTYVYSLFVDTLGAHPNGFYPTFTFDRATGSELDIGELFASDSGYLNRLSAIARFELAKSLGELVDIDYVNQGTTPEAANFQSFAIDGDALVLIFPPYQVAPYSEGTQTVSIPLSQLAEILKPAYRP